jgi:hypothetical protein
MQLKRADKNVSPFFNMLVFYTTANSYGSNK